MLTINVKGDAIMSNKKETMKQEAASRLRKLGVNDGVIKDFENDVLNVTVVEKGVFLGTLSHLDDNEKEMVRKIEEEYGGLVYHCIRCESYFGRLFNMLYVSKYEDEWEYDNMRIGQSLVFAYVENLSDPICSEFGSIEVVKNNGGLIRIS